MQEKDEQSSAAKQYKWVGKRPVRPDGVDKVTGRARFGADYNLSGQLWGKALHSPHPHARIIGIDTSRAEALPGVKAVVTAADFPDLPSKATAIGDMVVNLYYFSRNIMAREKVLYEGHPVAAVAATEKSIATAALKLIEVEYEILPHVLDPIDALKPDAPLLHDNLRTMGVKPRPTEPSNMALRLENSRGDMEKGFAEADIIVERELRTKPVHQGYIEPHACVANVQEDGKAELWTTTQGQWVARAYCAHVLGWDISQLRVIPTEIGGGFGGKIPVYEEPVALKLSQKARRPVKMVMNRDEVFRTTGPTSGSVNRIKIGAKNDGTLVAANAEFIFQAGAFPGSPVMNAVTISFAHYTIENQRVVGMDVVSNRPSVSPYRAPGGPIACYAVESVITEVAQKLGMDEIELRLKNGVKEGDTALHGLHYGPIGYLETLEAIKKSDHWNSPIGPNQGRGLATAFWKCLGGQTSVSAALNEDGTLSVNAGTPDIGGVRASLALMAAESMGIDYEKVNPMIGDTGQLGFNFVTAGSRTAYANGVATFKATQSIIKDVCQRAAKIWDIPEDAVIYEDGYVRPASSNAGDQEPMSLADIAGRFASTGGPITSATTTDGAGYGPTFGAHLVDVEVDSETGRVSIVRYTTFADAGTAVHPDYVEGQMQGGATQGIGWALNEEYVYGDDGRMQNPGFLDYRVPVASDLPMIETEIVEVPNPLHPFGVRGVGEISIVPSVGAVANAVRDATGLWFDDLPLSPPNVRKKIAAARAAGEALKI